MNTHFSSRMDISASSLIVTAEVTAKANGTALSKLNNPNPTRHGLAPELVLSVYTANLRGSRAVREALAALLNTTKAVDVDSPQSASPAVGEGGDERHVASNNVSTATEGVDPDVLYLLSSTSKAYSRLIKLLCDAGDVVLTLKPSYPLTEPIARFECVDTVGYQLQFDGSWFIDIIKLERLLSRSGSERIRALVLINPNSPTGLYVKPTERACIVTLCREHGIALIADEVFLDYSPEPFPGNARLAGERGVLTFVLDEFSRMLVVPHTKVGWVQISGPTEDVTETRRRLNVIADGCLPMSDIIAERIPVLLNAAPVQTRRMGECMRNNLAKLYELPDVGPNGLINILRAEGGWDTLLRVPSIIDENELALRLIDEHKLTEQPGYFFGMTSNECLVISLLPEPNEFERSIRAVLNTIVALLQ